MVSTFNPLSSFVIEKSEKKDRKINVKTHSSLMVMYMFVYMKHNMCICKKALMSVYLILVNAYAMMFLNYTEFNYLLFCVLHFISFLMFILN